MYGIHGMFLEEVAGASGWRLRFHWHRRSTPSSRVAQGQHPYDLQSRASTFNLSNRQLFAPQVTPKGPRQGRASC